MVNIDNNALLIAVEGEFNIYKVEALRKEILDNLKIANCIRIDMMDATKLDSAGFTLIYSLKKTCLEANKDFEVVNVQESSQKILQLFGFLNNFNSRTHNDRA